MTTFLLLLVKLLRPVVRSFGIDDAQWYAILEVKLTLDTRRPSPGLTQNRTGRNVFAWTLFFYTLMGVMMGMIIYAIPILFAMTIFFSYIMAMVAMTLILDFSTVLLDTSDNTIILPRPVNSRTLAAARLTHIILYITLITGSLSLASIIAVVLKYPGIMIAAFIIALILSTLFGVFLTTSGYMLALRVASEQRVKGIINGLQITMAVVFMAGYQILPRMIDKLEGVGEDMILSWWSVLAPPVWMSGALQAIHTGSYDTHHMMLMSLAILLPLILVYITFTRLTPVFNKRLVAMGGNVLSDATAKPSSLPDKVSQLFARHPSEQGAMSFVLRILGRDNRLKLKIYPSIGYLFVFGFIFVFNSKRDILDQWNTLADTRYYILLLYLPMMISQTALREIPFSDDHRASWIFQSTPIGRPGEILSGMAKAVVAGLLLPLYLVISIIVYGIWGNGVIDDILFAGINNYLIVWIMVVIDARRFPLSLAPNLRAQAGGFLHGLMVLLTTGIPSGGHYFLSFVPWSIYVVAPLVLALIYYLHQEYLSTPWSKIKLG
ncbi:MAG TPA: hypothetical protein PLX35_17855 [Cyclobacteriaceae bacterium]|nr:hypothetical protein [Cyclobacteriaceae bacterium]